MSPLLHAELAAQQRSASAGRSRPGGVRHSLSFDEVTSLDGALQALAAPPLCINCGGLLLCAGLLACSAPAVVPNQCCMQDCLTAGYLHMLRRCCHRCAWRSPWRSPTRGRRPSPPMPSM